MLVLLSFVFYALLLVMFVLGLLCPLALFFFGGARRNALAFYPTGLFLLLTGSWLLATFNASYLAKMDNAYLLNLGFGFWFVLVGSFLLVSCLAGYGLNRWLALGLGLVGAAGGYYSNSLASGLDSPDGGTPNVLFAAGLAGLLSVLVFLFGRWRAVLRDVLLGVVSAAAFLAIFGFIRPNLAVLSLNQSLDTATKPPVLGGGVWGVIAAFVCPVLAVAIFLVARAWNRPAQDAQPPLALDEPVVPQA